MKLTQNADLDKYGYSVYGIGFNGRQSINFVIFGADITSSVHIDDQKKNILVLGEGLRQGLDDTALT